MSFYKAQVGTELIILAACGLFAGASIDLSVMGFSLSTTTVIGSVPPLLGLVLSLLLTVVVFRESASAYHSTQSKNTPEQAISANSRKEDTESASRETENPQRNK